MILVKRQTLIRPWLSSNRKVVCALRVTLCLMASTRLRMLLMLMLCDEVYGYHCTKV